MVDKYFRKKTISHIMRDADSFRNGLQLKKNLNVRDLTALGIAAIVGAGIFSTIGTAAAHGGPAVSLLFIFTAIACGFSALCYAEFAARIPISGSAYTLCLRKFRRTDRLDYRVGPDYGIRRREYCGGYFLVRLFHRDDVGFRDSNPGIHDH